MTDAPQGGGGSAPASPPDRPLAARKLRDRAMVLPVVGMVLLLPPVASTLAVPISVFGVPLIVIYLFGVWAVLVWFARQLAHRVAVETQPGRAGTSSAVSGVRADMG